MKITYVDDYLNIVSKKFPNIPKKDIKRIMVYGWKQFYLVNSYGGDFMTRGEDGFWVYVGKICSDSLDHFRNYIHKLSIKLRIL